MKFPLKELLGWYANHRRSLPWRGETDPYRIWVAEVMLQQTQVEAVIPYYRRWLEQFPTVRSVAEASLDQVLKIWEGLGYYSRCRNVHRACQIVAHKYGGEVPSTWEEFRHLPGVGDYTAAAVLSFSFGKVYPVLDGNVSRVMARLTAFPEPVSKGKRTFLRKLEEWIDREDPARFNQAMMELGSLVCRKNQPRCFECPITGFCLGYRRGNPGGYPVRSSVKPRPHRTVVAGVIWEGNRFLIQKRPENGLLGGLWELPGGKVMAGESREKALVREIAEETGLAVTVKEPIGWVDHAYSHFSITLHAFHCSVVDGSRMKSERNRKWISPKDITRFAFPKANHKLFGLLDGEGWKP